MFDAAAAVVVRSNRPASIALALLLLVAINGVFRKFDAVRPCRPFSLLSDRPVAMMAVETY